MFTDAFSIFACRMSYPLFSNQVLLESGGDPRIHDNDGSVPVHVRKLLACIIRLIMCFAEMELYYSMGAACMYV